MSLRNFDFESAAEAEAFIRGIEYVNDSAISIVGEPQPITGGFTVLVDDEDAKEEKP